MRGRTRPPGRLQSSQHVRRSSGHHAFLSASVRCPRSGHKSGRALWSLLGCRTLVSSVTDAKCPPNNRTLASA
jgi:hypothetical protein